MRLITRCLTPVVFLSLLFPLAFVGCDGKGLEGFTPVSAGDQPPPQDDGGDGDNGGNGGNGGGGGGGGGSTTDKRFEGTWIASYGDDYTTSLAAQGLQQYLVQLELTQQGTRLGGTARMLRVFSEGAVAYDTVPGISIKLSGTASNDDATLTMAPANSGTLNYNPVWYLRLAGQRLVGMYEEVRQSDGEQVRAGHAVWYKSTSGSASNPWVSGFRDDFAESGLAYQDRTALLNLTQSGSNLIGDGTFVVQTDAEPLSQDFSVLEGVVQSPGIGFRLGDFDLIDNEINAFGLIAGSTMVSVYAQLGADRGLIRNGHAIWYRDTQSDPAVVSRVWTASFEDSATASGTARTAYLALMNLTAQNGGAVTGTASIRNETNNTTQSFNVAEGNIVGSQVHLVLTQASRRFVWDLRATSGILAGSYQQTDNNGEFISRGIAEWRPRSNIGLSGTWVASYADTVANGDLNTQFALVTVSNEDVTKELTGVGALRYPAENRRRLFNLEGDSSDQEIVWTWRSSDLFGPTEWRLRRSDGRLYGTYTNFDSGGNPESRGYGVWYRVSRTAAFGE